MKPMHILHLNSERTWRGGERQLAYLIEESLRAGFEITVMCRAGSAFYRWCIEKDVKVITAAFRNGLDVLTAGSIKSTAARNKVDVVHTHSGRAQSLAYMALRMGMKASVVAHRRVDFPLKSGGPSLAKYTHPGVKAIICVSHAIAKMVRERVNPADKVHVVHSGIDFSRFPDHPHTGFLHKAFGWEPDTLLVANVSALAPHKDYPTFIRTAHRVAEAVPNCRLLVVGEGKLRKELEKMAGEGAGKGRITFLGFREDVPEILRELDVFLITSETEGLGTTVIDAMYNGVPVVGTRAGGIPELVSDGDNGFLCAPGDRDCLADRVVKLLDDSVLRSQMGQSAQATARGFGMSRMAEKVFSIYREIFNNSPAR